MLLLIVKRIFEAENITEQTDTIFYIYLIIFLLILLICERHTKNFIF